MSAASPVISFAATSSGSSVWKEEKAALASDIRDVFAKAKGNGFDVTVMRQVLRLRRLDKDHRDELETVLDLYLRALGMA
jgi:uncharacterized protein (UPF0335 family)